MAPEKAPAFQFYPKDFLSDGNQGEMSLQEVGAYARLMCRCWLEKTIPDDAGRAANLCGATPLHMKKMWPAIRRCFRPHPDDATRLIHPRLELERDKQETYRRRQSDKGSKSAANRKATAVQPEGNHGSTGPPPERQPNLNSPISDLRSPIVNPSDLRRASALVEEEISERAGRFVERYGELFSTHRRGARHRSRPNLDWTEACDLVRLWDDARLDKLAQIVLTTDDPWISSTDRSFKIFAMKATWADDRLKQAETVQV